MIVTNLAPIFTVTSSKGRLIYQDSTSFIGIIHKESVGVPYEGMPEYGFMNKFNGVDIGVLSERVEFDYLTLIIPPLVERVFILDDDDTPLLDIQFNIDSELVSTKIVRLSVTSTGSLTYADIIRTVHESNENAHLKELFERYPNYLETYNFLSKDYVDSQVPSSASALLGMNVLEHSFELSYLGQYYDINGQGIRERVIDGLYAGTPEEEYELRIEGNIDEGEEIDNIIDGGTD